MGVFCGSYVTPIADGYFEHLEKVRGEGRKMKVMDKARKAVLGGVASDQDLQVAANGAAVDDSGNVVPAGTASSLENQNRDQEYEDLPPQVRDRMDISLHNIGDYA